MNNKWANLALYAVVFLVSWNVIDFLFTTFVTHEGYQFSVLLSVVRPVIVGLVVGYLTDFRKRDDK